MKTLLGLSKDSPATLLDDTLCNLLKFVSSINCTLFNERDLQIYLADQLKSLGYFDEIYLEYRLPKGCNVEFDKGYEAWETEQPSIDIVVRKDNSYIPIELKYKLKSYNGNFTRFGESVGSINIAKDQSAQNIGRYQFWKDVKRLELLKESYRNVIGGIALFITNDYNYQNTTSGADYEKFGMTSPQTGVLDWKNPYKKNSKGEQIRKSPCIELKKKYTPVWDNNIFEVHGEFFHCCHIAIE